ncbi:MAG: hypothetical protein AB1916_08645, partial [Thermodesulfobacteriota bacterium]
MDPLILAALAALLAFGAGWGFLRGMSAAASRRTVVRERLARAKGPQAPGLELERRPGRFPGLSLGRDVGGLLRRAGWSLDPAGLAGRCAL